MLRATDKVNVIPNEVERGLDGRLLPGFQPRRPVAELRAMLGADVEIEVTRHDPGPPSPTWGCSRRSAAILRELDPGRMPIPLLMAGVTDARFFARLGIQTYGFTPMNLPAGLQLLVRPCTAPTSASRSDAVDFGTEAIHRRCERYGEAA